MRKANGTRVSGIIGTQSAEPQVKPVARSSDLKRIDTRRIPHVRAFLTSRRGNFATMFALFLTTMLVAGSMAIDVARMYAVHSKMTSAIDAAVLATTQGLTQGDIPLADAKTRLLAYIEANLDGRNLKKDDVVIDNIVVDSSTKSLEVDAHTMMSMTMAGIVGFDSQKVSTSSRATYSDSKVEVVMALDITGSMYDKISGTDTRKIDSLKTASKLAVEKLFESTDATSRVRIGLVPYAEGVNAYPVITKIETTGSSWGCVYERKGPEKYTDAFSEGNAKLKGSWSGCPIWNPIVPLTSSKTTLNSSINALSTGGCTAGHVAIAWSYYMLSPKWNSAWPSTTSQAAEFNTAGVSKYAIIMTDGMFNFFKSDYDDCSNTYSEQQSKTYAENLCTSMKASGIRIYTIAFDAPSTAQELLSKCASPDSSTSQYYFNATNDQGLKDAFEAIALDIQGLRLTN